MFFQYINTTHTHTHTHTHTCTNTQTHTCSETGISWYILFFNLLFFHWDIYYRSVCNFQHLFCVFILWAISYTHIFLMDIELVSPISLFVYFNFIDNQKFTNEQWSESSKRELAFRSEIFVYYIPGKFIFSLNQ